MTRFSKLAFTALLAASAALAQSPLVAVTAKPVSRMVNLPAEIVPYLSVAVHARVAGYVETIAVDRGSYVKKGQAIAVLSAPEMKAQMAEAASKIEAIEADRLQAEAHLAAAKSTAEKLKRAAETPGAIAANELVLADAQVSVEQASVRSRESAKRAAEANLAALKELESYLKIEAPFDGVVTERFLHPGALVGPPADPALLTIEQVSRLRVVVAVPEDVSGGTRQGATVAFHVPAFPDRAYSGVVARQAHALDQKTRTMAVELDVMNRDGSLAPGMFPTVKWPVKIGHSAMMVPKTSVVTTTERTFVIRNKSGRAEWVDVKKGVAEGDLVEVSGELKPGDQVVRRATDELRPGDSVPAK